MEAGSSPRVRGKPRRAHGRRAGGRLIPACAGKTRPVPARQVRGRAHPRVCGENSLAAQDSERAWGSSPRVRGKLIEVERSTGDIGLIPACAGKTRSTH